MLVIFMAALFGIHYSLFTPQCGVGFSGILYGLMPVGIYFMYHERAWWRLAIYIYGLFVEFRKLPLNGGHAGGFVAGLVYLRFLLRSGQSPPSSSSLAERVPTRPEQVRHVLKLGSVAALVVMGTPGLVSSSWLGLVVVMGAPGIVSSSWLGLEVVVGLVLMGILLEVWDNLTGGEHE
jgi:hypothetical protein